MRYGTGITLAIVIILVISGYFGYQYYSEQHVRSERISLLMKYANISDYAKASLFDEKYSYLASDGKYNQSVLDFFLHWLANNSLDYTQYLREQQRFERIHTLMKHANTTDYASALLFDNKYSYMANVNSYNQSVSEFFSHWLVNRSLAETCLEILVSVEEANRYLAKLGSAATNYGSKDDLTLILSALTDKNEYSAKDKINYTIIVLSNKNLGEVPITIFGFKNRYGAYKVNNRWIANTNIIEINVKTGLNVESFIIDIPCAPCYQVDSGLHNLTCLISYNGLNVNVTKYIILR